MCNVQCVFSDPRDVPLVTWGVSGVLLPAAGPAPPPVCGGAWTAGALTGGLTRPPLLLQVGHNTPLSLYRTDWQLSSVPWRSSWWLAAQGAGGWTWPAAPVTRRSLCARRTFRNSSVSSRAKSRWTRLDLSVGSEVDFSNTKPTKMWITYFKVNISKSSLLNLEVFGTKWGLSGSEMFTKLFKAPRLLMVVLI